MAASGTGSGGRGAAPWVALLLVTAFGLATLHMQRSSAPQVVTARERLSEASLYFAANPYLEPGQALHRHLGDDRVRSIRRSYEEERAARDEARVLAGVMRHQQRELDALTDDAARALDSLPARTMGVDPSDWRPVTWLQYVALHSSWRHLAGSAVLLLLLGLYLEPALGTLRTALVTLGATLGGALGYAFEVTQGSPVLIGSSGLLAGWLAVFAWELRASRREPFYALGLVAGLLWLVLPPRLGAAWGLSYPGVELLGDPPSADLVFRALLGGAVGGLSTHWVLLLLGGQRDQDGMSHSARTSTGSATLDQALEERAAGRDEVAYQKLAVLLHKEPEQLDAALLMADVARALGRHSAADSAMLRAIRIEAKRDQTTAAVRHWLDLTQREIPRETDAALLIRMATLLRHHDHPRAASQALRAALERATGSNTAPVATRIARAAQELDPTIAHDAAWRALGCIELTLEERQNLEDLLAVVMPRLPGAEVMLSNAWADGARRPEAIEVDTHTRVLDIVRAIPLRLDDEGLHIATRGGAKKRVLYERIEAVAVAAVQGIAPKPVLVVDVVLNWKETREPKLRLIRMRGDRFDPRRVVRAETALEAFRTLVQTLLERATAVPLPDRESALGSPFASFEELALYERTVLMAESPLSENDA